MNKKKKARIRSITGRINASAFFRMLFAFLLLDVILLAFVLFPEGFRLKGWQPDYLRQLGEGAIVAGDAELAKRNFRQLMRCPFRGDQAAKRLAALEMEPPPPDAFDDLADVAGMFGVWQDHVAKSGTVYFGNDRIVERFVYSLFMTLESCPPPMLKMLFASALLSNNAQMLKDNSEALSKLYPDGRIGPVFLEALR